MATPPEKPADDADLTALNRELTRLRSELEQYQNLIDDLPSIYETKFRSQARDVAQDLRRLMDERRSLQHQLQHAVAPGAKRRAALPSAPAPKPAPEPAPQPSAQQTPHQAVQVPEPPPPPAKPVSIRPRQLRRRFNHSIKVLQQSSRQLAGSRPLQVTAATAVLVLVALGAFSWWRDSARRTAMPRPSTATNPAATASQPQRPPADLYGSEGPLRLRALGESWVVVETLEGELLYVNTLQSGEERVIGLRDGALRLRSGRPDLLEVAVGDQPFQMLGSINDLDWKTVRQVPTAPQLPATTLPTPPPVPEGGAPFSNSSN